MVLYFFNKIQEQFQNNQELLIDFKWRVQVEVERQVKSITEIMNFKTLISTFVFNEHHDTNQNKE